MNGIVLAKSGVVHAANRKRHTACGKPYDAVQKMMYGTDRAIDCKQCIAALEREDAAKRRAGK